MNKYIKYLLKGSFLIAIVFIIDKIVFSDENIIRIGSIEQRLNKTNYFILLTVFILQFLNWGIEAIKFKYIISKTNKISVKESLLAVYTGNATGLFTPDRLGNFIGRFIYLNKINKTTITAATLLGNLAQLISTISFALVALLLYLSLELKITIPYLNPTLILAIIIASLILLIYSFYTPSKIVYFITKIKWINKHKQTFSFLTNFNKKESSYIILLSLLRYVIFIIQFHLLLNAFGMKIELIETITFSGILYLITTFIPSPLMGNLGTREVISIILLSNYQQPEIALIASLIIWLINVIFPSLVGSFLLLKMNPSKQKV